MLASAVAVVTLRTTVWPGSKSAILDCLVNPLSCLCIMCARTGGSVFPVFIDVTQLVQPPVPGPPGAHSTL